jgi:hypothetical protein
VIGRHLDNGEGHLQVGQSIHRHKRPSSSSHYRALKSLYVLFTPLNRLEDTIAACLSALVTGTTLPILSVSLFRKLESQPRTYTDVIPIQLRPCVWYYQVADVHPVMTLVVLLQGLQVPHGVQQHPCAAPGLPDAGR